MPTRRDGRIEPGQPLKTAISAAAWNRAQDAADMLMGQRPGVTADGPRLRGLPQVTVALPIRGYFGQAARLDQQSAASEYVAPGTPPGLNNYVWDYTEYEREMRPLVERQVLPLTVTSSVFVPDVAFTVAPSEPLGEPQPLICTDNESHHWVVSGYAVTRVRVFNYGHRHARFARSFPGSTSGQNAAASGCLDSAFYGPAQIVAYAAVVNGSVVWNNGQTTQSPLQYPSFVLRWALVRL